MKREVSQFSACARQESIGTCLESSIKTGKKKQVFEISCSRSVLD